MVMEVMFPLASYIAFDSHETSWFDQLTVDAAYLHITAFAGEALTNKVRGQECLTRNQAVMQHFSTGVRLLRQRIEKGDIDAKVADSTISIVLILAISAHLMNDRTARQHMEGIHRMILLRGGLVTLRNQKLKMEICR